MAVLQSGLQAMAAWSRRGRLLSRLRSHGTDFLLRRGEQFSYRR
ncbi:hypothetical protein STVIR_5810 [Streptomyces viridochromogenes Tue57]|uniref:Uncharacterized protein n=1 Tax=Streptomyces viridochromogenes Tue57 TaxID=1160705 RepID=L8PAS5_STRVR|nr:hypothetical protein STVIR_5810 [Streptomyces viridochromogenes Tue57]